MKITSKEQLFKKIETEREKRVMSVYRLAKETGFSTGAWFAYQKGDRNPSWENLFTAAKALDMNIEITLKK
jgi:transcriptional regulator with XRE-family HTH domain